MKRFIYTAVVLTVGLTNMPVLAQVNSPETIPSAVPSATSSSQATDSPEASPVVSTEATETSNSTTTPRSSWYSIVVKKLQRFFTIDKVKRSQLTLELGAALLSQVQAEEATGQTSKALSTLDKYNREMGYLSVASAVLAKNTDDPRITTFLDTLLVEKTQQLTTLDTIVPESADSVARKLIRIRSQAIREITKIVSNPELSTVERERKLAKVMAKYSEKETRLEAKIAKKLALTSAMSENNEEQVFEVELQEQEDKTLEDVDELDHDSINKLGKSISGLSIEQRLPLLARLRLKVETNDIDDDIDEAIDELEHNASAKRHVIGRLSDDDDFEDIISVIEERDEKLSELLKQNKELEKKDSETKREEQKKANEQKLEQLKEASSKKQEKSKKTKEDKIDKKGRSAELPSNSTEKTEPTARPSATTGATEASTSASSSPSSTKEPSEQEKTTVEIKIKEGRFDKTSYSVKKGSLLTVKVKNEDDDSRTITLSNGQSSGVLAEDQTKSLSAFTINGTVTFESAGVGSGLITAE